MTLVDAIWDYFGDTRLSVGHIERVSPFNVFQTISVIHYVVDNNMWFDVYLTSVGGYLFLQNNLAADCRSPREAIQFLADNGY